MKFNYLSQEGYDRLNAELHDLKTRGRKDIAEEIAEARAKGDLSENAEYDAAKEAQGHLETRILELENVMANARVIDESKIDATKAFVGSTLTILNKKMKKEMKYTLVSPQEADMTKNKISIESHIGKALLGKSLEDEVTVNVPVGELTLILKKIERLG